jgi:SAM-dependent methyltransferase
MSRKRPPDWRLPLGVNAALWEYAHTDWLAESEDGVFLDHPLCREDVRQVSGRFTEPGPLVDLGCGVGRMSLHFARRGFPVVAVELSHAMLRKLGESARAENLRIGRVEANLCHLGCLASGSFAYGLSMFSTLGMIRGRDARRRALAEAARVLRPGGRLALHAHNFWLNLWLPQGRSWLLSQAGLALLGRPGVGDRRMTYRGIPRMEVHLYRWRELRRDLAGAGFRIEEIVPIDAVHALPIRFPRWLHGLRAGGWLVFARSGAGS